MPRFFFHLHECGTVCLDEEGRELPDIQAAHNEAIVAARAVMCAEVSNGKLCLSCRIEIEDSNRRPVLQVPFTEAVEIRNR